MTVGNAGNLAGNVVENAMFTRRTSGGYASIKSGAATIKALKGNTIVWNQLIRNGNFADGTDSWTIVGNWSETETEARVTSNSSAYAYNRLSQATGAISGHKILWRIRIKTNSTRLVIYPFYGSGQTLQGLTPDTWQVISGIRQADSSSFQIFIGEAEGGGYEGSYVAIDKSYGVVAIDLTLMFGAGNEPSTVEEFEALFPLDYYAYNAGELLSFNGTGIKTDGFNQWDGSKARVFGGQAYYINGTYSTLKFAKTIDGEQTDITPSSNLYTPTEDGYIFATGTSAEFCINLSHSGIRNGEYEPYWTETKQLPSLDFFDVTYTGADGQQHVAGGMKSAGTPRDEWNGTKKVRRIGVVDLGTLNWGIFKTSTYRTTFTGIKNGGSGGLVRDGLLIVGYTITSAYALYNETADDKTYTASAGAFGADYIAIRDSAYPDAASFKAAMSGVLLFYELAEPVEADAEPLGIYKEDDWGTETLLPENDDEPTTSPIIADIMYGIDAVGTIRNLPKDYISKVSMDSVLSAMVSAGIIGGYTLTYNGRSYDCTITPISTE